MGMEDTLVTSIDTTVAPLIDSQATEADRRLRLRREMLIIQNDDTLNDKQKAICMQTLMTKDYVTLSYQRPLAATLEVGHPLSALDLAQTFADGEAGLLGCKHYRRNCKLQ